MAMIMNNDAILGIAFGAIFGVLFIAVCVISAIKAVKDRNKIKARIAERAQHKHEKLLENDVITEPTSVNSSIEENLRGATRPKRHIDKARKIQTCTDDNATTREKFKVNCSNTKREVTRYVSVEINNMANGGRENTRDIYTVSGNTADSPPVYVEAYAQNDAKDVCATNDLSHMTADRHHSLSNSHIPDDRTNTRIDCSVQSSNKTRPQKYTNCRNKAWEQKKDAKSSCGIETENGTDIEVVNNESGRGESQWKDKTYFGMRSRTSDMDIGVYRHLVDGQPTRVAYQNTAYQL